MNLHGLDLGPKDKLLGAHPSNAMGHFEHARFLDINNALLKHFGGSWDNPPDLQPEWEREPSIERIVDQARDLLARISGSALWGWKDPRTTILLPFWQMLIPNLRFVICVRNPLEVARSLRKRNGMSIGAGAYLWYRYTHAGVQDTENYPRTISFYESYFGNPLGELDRVAEFCGLVKQDDTFRVEAVVSKDLRHQTSDSLELLDEVDIPLEYKLFYLGLRAMWFDELSVHVDDRHRLERITISPGKILRLVDKYRGQEPLMRLENTLAKKEIELNELRNMIEMKDNQIGRLEQKNGHLRAFSDSVRQTWAYRSYRTFIRPFKRG